MAKKMTFNAVANTGISKYIAPGAVDCNSFTVGFLVVGRASTGTDVMKPVSKKEYVDVQGDRFESKSACVKDYYRNLRLFTDAVQADFNKSVSHGMRVAMVKRAESGRRNYTLFEPKAETGGSDAGKAAVVAENAKLKAQLAKMMAVLKTAGLLEDEAVEA